MKGSVITTNSELLGDARILDLMLRQVNKYTSELARYEKIKKVALLEHEMTTESGELTPTLKPRRRVIEKKYAAMIDRLYAERARRLKRLVASD